MHRITVVSLVTAIAFVALAAPAATWAGGCEVLGDPGDRATCVAREQARSAARAEVQRELDDAAPARGAARANHSVAWTKALDEADGVDVGELVDLRLLAAVGGLAWFFLVLRARRRRGRHSRT